MPAVQSSYTENQRAAVAGMVANMNNSDADTRIVETEAGIGFGLACGQGAADNGAVLGAAAAAGFVGVSIRDITLEPADEDKYVKGTNMGVLTEGDIWVTVGGNVSPGSDVTFNKATGVLSSIGADTDNYAIAGARWMTTATNGGLAVLRLSGHLPSA